ncbi:hypothetical protein D9613_010023 [Agrocybe pediades]|uniref:Ubiquitin-like domain-containing protein n=1 Tax=Agrocybe pediades TaxID=84607 RepID=A0A8H4QYU8_9AGAR|nr:hypothetical protein D9613_010023 [Agrocybe pediades]
MAEQAEKAFARTFLNTLATQPVTYADDYQQAPEHSLKRVPVLPIPVPPPAARKPRVEPSASTSASISITFKSLKPPASFTLQVQPTDTISAIKAQLAASTSTPQLYPPPADAQRLLLKGKALADAKLLKEYSVKDGDTVNLVVKPGFDWNPQQPPAPSTTNTPAETMSDASSTPAKPSGGFSFASLDPNPSTPVSKKTNKHTRIPSVVLSPSPSADTPGAAEKDILLTLDVDASRSPVSQLSELGLSSYAETVKNPEFWVRLYAFLQQEFTNETDVHTAFEDFLCASKGSLTPHEIAKIRDTTGVVGMAGR